MMVAPRQQAGGLMWVTGFAARAVTQPPGRDAERYVRHEVHIDDRGLALIRDGEPDEIAPPPPRWRGLDLPQRRPAGAAHLRARAEPVRRCVLRSQKPARLRPRRGPDELDPGACANRAELIRRLADYDGRYRRLFLHGGNNLARLQDDQALDQLGQRTADHVASSESAAPRFAETLPAAFELLDFASASPDSSDVTLAIAVPA